jgi:hypothetical protein
MTTLTALADRCQNAIDDAAAGTWLQATVEEWVKEAIRDYSTHFPRLVVLKYDCTAATHAYTLPADFLGVISVEYPKDEDPPQFLAHKSHLEEDFWDAEGYYDVQAQGDAVTPGTLWISESPAATEDINLTYSAYHDLAPTNITVPGHHEHLLVLFVVWKAAAERLMKDQGNVNILPSLLAARRLVASNMRDAYDAAIRLAEKQQAPGGWTGPWKADIHDPIY